MCLIRYMTDFLEGLISYERNKRRISSIINSGMLDIILICDIWYAGYDVGNLGCCLSSPSRYMSKDLAWSPLMPRGLASFLSSVRRNDQFFVCFVERLDDLFFLRLLHHLNASSQGAFFLRR